MEARKSAIFSVHLAERHLRIAVAAGKRHTNIGNRKRLSGLCNERSLQSSFV
jgi:hypothetical protein